MIGAVVTAAVAVAIEPYGALLYRALREVVHPWGAGFWMLAAAIGALWGGWLPASFVKPGAPLAVEPAPSSPPTSGGSR